MKSPSKPCRRSIFRHLGVCLALIIANSHRDARAQATPALAKAADVFDDDKGAATKSPVPATKSATLPDRETIGFNQENVAAQMLELEERMFRLSEALRGLEPENASRLRLALKFSREEQILDQMKETHKFLKDAQVSKAETEVRELLAKLEHLRNLLLAEDLDFQLKLARLRQLRETLAQVERIAKEERRELGWSRFAIEQRKSVDRLVARRPDLESLARDQKSVIADTNALSKDDDTATKEARAAIRAREIKVRNAVTALASDPLFSDLQPAHLRRADTQLGESLTLLEGSDAQAASASETKALNMIGEELARLDDQMKQTEKNASPPEFKRREADQAKNRTSTDTLSEVSSRLGDTGMAMRKDLIRASASMRLAEERLAKSSAEPAAEDQSTAIELLAKSAEDLGESVEKLLVELRTELQARLIAEITELHEIQMLIRENTQAQAPKVLQKSRTALIAVAGLSKKEGELAGRTEKLLGMVEETEFGIALPTTLRVFSREMKIVESWLKDGDASTKTVTLETRVEEDLLALLGSVRRLPPTSPPPPGAAASADGREREREINRQVAELKMIRLLQSRLNDDTIGVDKNRAADAPMTTALRHEVEALEATQDEVRDSLAKIAERLESTDGN